MFPWQKDEAYMKGKLKGVTQAYAALSNKDFLDPSLSELH